MAQRYYFAQNIEIQFHGFSAVIHWKNSKIAMVSMLQSIFQHKLINIWPSTKK